LLHRFLRILFLHLENPQSSSAFLSPDVSFYEHTCAKRDADENDANNTIHEDGVKHSNLLAAVNQAAYPGLSGELSQVILVSFDKLGSGPALRS